MLVTELAYGKCWLLGHTTVKWCRCDEVLMGVVPQAQGRGPGRRAGSGPKQRQSLPAGWVGLGQAKTLSGRNSITRNTRRKLQGHLLSQTTLLMPALQNAPWELQSVINRCKCLMKIFSLPKGTGYCTLLLSKSYFMSASWTLQSSSSRLLGLSLYSEAVEKKKL